MSPRCMGLAWLGVLFLAPITMGAEDDATYFEKQVRPVLIERCNACHGEEKQRGNLRLDSRAAMLAGGDSGAALVPNKPTESLLIRALSHDDAVKMPPKEKLSQKEIAILSEWVRRGAPWPNAKDAAPVRPAATEEPPLSDEERAFWAFHPVRRPAVPVLPGVQHPIDAFLQTARNTHGLTVAPPADRRTLIRRAMFDLTGLPPTAEEIEAFVNDPSPGAYAALIERLLASPAYGEKWGRRWLDVARYADSNGMDENLAYVNAWRYRDWVIRAMNADMPYDAFVRAQIAGDLLPAQSDAERADNLIATGFLVFGPKMLAEDDPVKMQMDIIDEQLDTLGQAILGLTMGCARCHDHKFDPIRTSDYYGLAGILYSTKTMQNHKVVAAWNERPLDPKQVAAAQSHEQQVNMLKGVLGQVTPPSQAALGSTAGQQALQGLVQTTITQREAQRPTVDQAMAVEDAKGQNIRIHRRGSHLTLGPEVPRRFPRIIAGDEVPALGENTSGRKELADWLTRPDNPLTARVMVNRLWLGHFGQGIVRSPDNFGRLGERPTHPELLDWLAAEFIHRGWSLKAMHRLIMTSQAYQMSSRGATDHSQQDPDNQWLTHFQRRRLDAEEIRDGMLAVSGRLDRSAGGTLLKANPRQYVTSTANRNYEGYAVPRRSVYLPIVRSAVFDVLQTLDFPDPSVPAGQRATTTIPTQALLMLNSPLVQESATALATSIQAASTDDTERIGLAYRKIFGRAPSAAEVTRVQAYLAGADREQAWMGLCRTLLASNEFVFVD